VSSTGHLFLFSRFFPFSGLGDSSEEFEDLFDIFIQSGAILSVVFLYFQKFATELKRGYRWIRGERTEECIAGFRFLTSLVVGSLPIMLLGFLLRKYLDGIKSQDNLLMILGFAWLAGGIGILIQESYFRRKDQNQKEEKEQVQSIQLSDFFVIGILQCLALIPGVSRSLATIFAGRVVGLSRKMAAEYSFFLAVPVLVTAGLYKLIRYRSILGGENLWILMYGTFVSFVLCVFVIRIFLAYVKRHDFTMFGYYRIALGMIVLTYFFTS